jgi:high-affinity Fe2+/Pb2+ permease
MGKENGIRLVGTDTWAESPSLVVSFVIVTVFLYFIASWLLAVSCWLFELFERGQRVEYTPV